MFRSPHKSYRLASYQENTCSKGAPQVVHIQSNMAVTQETETRPLSQQRTCIAPYNGKRLHLASNGNSVIEVFWHSMQASWYRVASVCRVRLDGSFYSVWAPIACLPTCEIHRIVSHSHRKHMGSYLYGTALHYNLARSAGSERSVCKDSARQEGVGGNSRVGLDATMNRLYERRPLVITRVGSTVTSKKAELCLRVG